MPESNSSHFHSCSIRNPNTKQTFSSVTSGYISYLDSVPVVNEYGGVSILDAVRVVTWGFWRDSATSRTTVWGDAPVDRKKV
jgi:hypothetical protein